MAVQERSTEAFVEQALADLAACYAGVMISTGHKLGLYRALAGQGPLSSYELAARTGCEERYVREWLNSQVAGGYLAYHEESETYELPAEHVPVLARRGQPDVPAAGVRHPRIDVVRPGADRSRPSARATASPGASTTRGSSTASPSFYRNAYSATLVPEWLPALDGVVEKLERGARVADIGTRPRALDDPDGLRRSSAPASSASTRTRPRSRQRAPTPRRRESRTGSTSGSPTRARTRGADTT